MTLQQLMVRLIDQQEGGTPARIDALLDLMVVVKDLAGDLSNESHASSLDYEKSARTSQDVMEDKKYARLYAKDALAFVQAADGINKVYRKLYKKINS
jgi:hypothetical protein